MTLPPRSLLFTPGSRTDRFAKAAASGADAVILDLEDAVAENEKAAARANVVAFLAADRPNGCQLIVRINSLARVCGLEDLAALASVGAGADLLLLPKVEAPAQVAAAAAVLDDAGSTTRLAALIESAKGVAAAVEVAQSHERLSFLMLGAADYAADLGLRVDLFRPDFARATLVNAAAAGGIVAIDTPFFAIDQSDRLEQECKAGRDLGFYGKAAIHPSQLQIINDNFNPTTAERDYAQRILQTAPDGVGVLDGKMVDVAMVRWASRIA